MKFKLVISFGVITLFFALIFKYLPEVKVAWRDVWIGAAVTALLFVIGRFLLGFYLGNSKSASGYGTAGSLVIILLWIYYSSQILFFGAEFTQVYARTYGSRIVPAENAVGVTEEARGEEGIPKEETLKRAAERQKRGAAGGQPSPTPAAGSQVIPTTPAKQVQIARYGTGVLGFLVGAIVGIIWRSTR